MRRFYSNQNIRNKRGFTLVEVLLIIAVIGFLGVAAISSYMDSTATFNFLAQYKSVFSSIRTARSYAVTNVDNANDKRYGVEVVADGITVFADSGIIPFALDDSDTKMRNKTYTFKDTSYRISVENIGIELPVYLFYERGSGKLTSYWGENYILIPKTDQKYITFSFYEEGKDFEGYIVVFQISGLAESFNKLSE